MPIINKPKNCSVPEGHIEQLLDYLFPKLNIHRNHRPNWLKNPRTGRNLELDFFIGKPVRVGIEYQGYQHFYESRYGDLDYSQYKDTLKRKLAWKNRRVCIMEIFESEYRDMIKLSERRAGEYLLRLAKKRLKGRGLDKFKRSYNKQKRAESLEYKNSMKYLSEIRNLYLHQVEI